MSVIILKRFCDTYFKVSCLKYQLFSNGKKNEYFHWRLTWNRKEILFNFLRNSFYLEPKSVYISFFFFVDIIAYSLGILIACYLCMSFFYLNREINIFFYWHVLILIFEEMTLKIRHFLNYTNIASNFHSMLALYVILDCPESFFRFLRW